MNMTEYQKETPYLYAPVFAAVPIHGKSRVT